MLRIFFRSSNETWTFGGLHALLLNTEVRALTGALDAASYLLAQPGSRLPAASRTHICSCPCNAAKQRCQPSVDERLRLAHVQPCARMQCVPGRDRREEDKGEGQQDAQRERDEREQESSCRVHSNSLMPSHRAGKTIWKLADMKLRAGTSLCCNASAAHNPHFEEKSIKGSMCPFVFVERLVHKGSSEEETSQSSLKSNGSYTILQSLGLVGSACNTTATTTPHTTCWHVKDLRIPQSAEGNGFLASSA